MKGLAGQTLHSVLPVRQTAGLVPEAINNMALQRLGHGGLALTGQGDLELRQGWQPVRLIQHAQARRQRCRQADGNGEPRQDNGMCAHL